jgi:hypothetical protein
MRLDNREPEGENGVKVKIRCVSVDWTCIFSALAGWLDNSGHSCWGSWAADKRMAS